MSKLYWNANESIDQLQSEVSSLKQEINQLTVQYNERLDRLNELRVQSDNLRSELESRKIQLSKMESRQETVFRKPTLVERMINKSYNKFQEEVECTTSKQSYCQ